MNNLSQISQKEERMSSKKYTALPLSLECLFVVTLIYPKVFKGIGDMFVVLYIFNFGFSVVTLKHSLKPPTSL